MRPPPDYAREIWKRKTISTVRPTVHTNPSRKQSFSKTLFKPEEFEKVGFAFSLGKIQARPHAPHQRNLKLLFSLWKRIKLFPHAGEIWKRNNPRSFWSCVWGNLGQENHVIIVTLSFFKMLRFRIVFRPHELMRRRRFQIPPVWRVFSKSSVFVTD